MSIGSRLETNFLYDNWLEGTGPLINHLFGVEEEYLRQLSVREFYDSPFCDRDWLVHRLTSHIADNLLTFHPLADESLQDSYIWTLTASSWFTLKSTVRFLMHGTIPLIPPPQHTSRSSL